MTLIIELTDFASDTPAPPIQLAVDQVLLPASEVTPEAIVDQGPATPLLENCISTSVTTPSQFQATVLSVSPTFQRTPEAGDVTEILPVTVNAAEDVVSTE